MTHWSAIEAKLRRELWDDRVVSCYPERPLSLAHMLVAAAGARPDGEALVADGQRLSWRQFETRAARLAGGLARAGVQAGDRVLLLLGNGLPFVLLAFAAAKLGAVIVPVSTREQQAGVSHVLRDARASAIFFEGELEAVLPPPSEREFVRLCVDVEGLAFAELFRASPFEGVASEPGGAAAILYTSGTTGRPKGAVLTNRNIVHSAMNYVETMGLGPADRTLIAVPVSHVTGLVALIAAATCAAGAMIVMREFDAVRFLDQMEAERISHTVIVPAMFNLCLLRGGMEGRDLSVWRVAGYGGAPMALSTIEALARVAPGLALMNIYGATETASPAVIMPPRFATSHRAAVGAPAPGAEILVMDGDREAAPGEVGELWIRGPMVSPGYWGDAEATSREFVAGFWRSGDLGKVDADGFVYVHDRLKDMINRGGYKIYSAEVESQLVALPGVVEAAVLGRPCPVLGERVHAVVVVESAQGAPTAAELRRRLEARLADYKIPETWSIEARPLPRNANGKVLKRQLRELLPPLERAATRSA